MLLQWAGAVLTAAIVSPRTWSGTASSVHIHVWASIILGGIITVVPVGLALVYPTHALTRQVIAAGQMLMSALLIHLTGGRVETHDRRSFTISKVTLSSVPSHLNIYNSGRS